MHKFAAAPRWIFLATLVYAPWAYGCTRPWTIVVLNVLLAIVFALWLAACVLDRRWPRIPRLVLLVSAALLVQGWFMAWNAHQLYDSEFFQFVPVASPVPAAPGAIDGPAVREAMIRITALLGTLIFAIDFFQDKVWRRRFAWTFFATGSSLITFGLVQRILAAPMIFWGESRETQHFFATYFYHGNAGSFINLVLPLIVLWTMRMFREPGRDLARAYCIPAVLVTIAGAFVNVSKAAMTITVGLLFVLGILHLREFWRTIRDRGASRATIGAAILIAALSVLILAGGWERTWTKWSHLPEILRDNPRAIAAQVAGRMTADSGVWGLGPGTFAFAFPLYTGSDGARIAGVWRFLHQDYLQTVIEWGWLGAAGWGVLIFGGVAMAAQHVWKKNARLSESRPLFLGAALGLGATALHALVDFPFQIASLQLYVVAFLALGWSAAVRPQL